MELRGGGVGYRWKHDKGLPSAQTPSSGRACALYLRLRYVNHLNPHPTTRLPTSPLAECRHNGRRPDLTRMERLVLVLVIYSSSFLEKKLVGEWCGSRLHSTVVGGEEIKMCASYDM